MTVRKLASPVVLGHVKGQRPMQLLCQSLFNRFGVEAWGLAVHYDDTTATYDILTEQYLTKPRLAEVCLYTEGVLAGMSAAGLI